MNTPSSPIPNFGAVEIMNGVRIFLLLLLTLPLSAICQTNLGIGTTSPNASAILDMTSTTLGLLPPRMTQVQRVAIGTPSAGLLVWQNDNTPGYQYYNGLTWRRLGLVRSLLVDTDGDTRLQVEKNPDEDVIRFDLAGTEHAVLRKNLSGHPRLEFPGNNGRIYIGNGSGGMNTSGINIAIGDSALANVTSGTVNIAFGRNALARNMTGSLNVAAGNHALEYNTASNNTAAGYQALRLNTTGTSNTALGMRTLYQNVTGSENTAVGALALFLSTTASFNTAIGFKSLMTNNASNNTGAGAYTLVANTSGQNNVAAGYRALEDNTTGSDNTAIGFATMSSSSAVSQTVAAGTDALRDLTTGTLNTAVGYQAMQKTTTGGSNSAFGTSALFNNLTGNRNTAIGYRALYLNTGSRNVGIGYQALTNNTIGTNNTAIGYTAGDANTTGTENTLIGYDADVSSGTLTNATAIGSGARVTLSNTVILGVTSSARVGIGTPLPHEKAILDLTSTTRGFLPPRMTHLQMHQIEDPAEGLLVYDNDARSLRYQRNNLWADLNHVMYDLGGIIADYGHVPVYDGMEWEAGFVNLLEDNDGDSKMQIEKNPDEDIFRLRLNGTERLEIGANVFGYVTYQPKGKDNCLYLGSGSGEFASSGLNNTGAGYRALRNTNTGSQNTAIGSNALESNTSGSSNVAIGMMAFSSNTSGSSNVAAGYQAMDNHTSGSNNVAIGAFALDALATQNRNTAVGIYAEATGSATTNATAIGPYARVTSSNAVVLGSIQGINGASSSTTVGIGTTAPDETAALHIFRPGPENLVPIMTLEETEEDFARIKFRNNTTAEEWGVVGKPESNAANARFNFFYGQNILTLEGLGDAVLAGTLTQTSDARLKESIKRLDVSWNVLNRIQARTYYWKDSSRSRSEQIGFLADEVLNVFPQLVKTNDDGYLTLNYLGFVPVLIEAVKMADQDIDETSGNIIEDRNSLEAMRRQIELLKASRDKQPDPIHDDK